MAEQVTIDIITAQGVQNLADLRKAIKDAKANLETLEIGSKEYKSQLDETIKMQNLMKNAMYGTSASMEDLKKAAEGTSQTYNGLVTQMANLKRELRSTDVSTAEGAAKFKDLASQINAVNDQLKEMDAMQGNYQRNVGNYTSAFKNFGDIMKDYAPALGGVAKGIGDVDKSVQLLSKQPILGVLGLVAPLLVMIAESLKEDEGAMAAVKKGLDALKPVTDLFQGILNNVVSILADLIGKVSEFVSGNGLFQKLITGVMGVGNAILQFIVAPFKGVAAAIRVFQEEGVKGIGNAAKAFGEEMKNGVSFKSNFEAGQVAAETLISGVKSKKEKAKEAGKELAKDTADAWTKQMEEMDKRIAEANKKYEQRLLDRQAMEKEMAALSLDLEKRTDEEIQAYTDQLMAEQLAAMQAEFEEEQRIQKGKVAMVQAYASGLSSIMGSVADALESGTDVTEAEAKKAKNLRIASATIDMLQGAVTAYSAAQSLGVPAGPIVGAINAAAVMAMGLANIAKIKSTQVSKSSGSTSSTPTAAAATVAAPALETSVPTTTLTTGARTETALNNVSKPQRVYVVQSDIEAAGKANRVAVDESSF